MPASDDRGWKMADILVKIAVPVLLGLVGALGGLLGWGYTDLSDQNRALTTKLEAQTEALSRASSRLDVIEATRYTPADAAKTTETLNKVLVLLARVEENGKATQEKVARIGSDVALVAKALQQHRDKGSHPGSERRFTEMDRALDNLVDRVEDLEKR